MRAFFRLATTGGEVHAGGAGGHARISGSRLSLPAPENGSRAGLSTALRMPWG